MTYCNGEAQNDAQIGVTSAPTGGWGAPYQYRVVTDGNAGSFTDQMTFTVGVGTHYIEVRDSRGCTRKLDSFTFVPYHGPSMQLQAPNAPTATKIPSCVGSQDGEIKLTGVIGGSVTATTPSPDMFFISFASQDVADGATAADLLNGMNPAPFLSGRARDAPLLMNS